MPQLRPNQVAVLSSNKAINLPDFSKGAETAGAVIFSVEGETLSDNERDLFKAYNPFGFILFARNCKDPKQLRSLIQDLKATVGRDCPVLVDQEGGRVQRLKPPYWRVHPPCKVFGDLAACGDIDQALEDCRFRTLRIADELRDTGINVNCDPVLDVFFENAHDVIGDRAFSDNPDIVGRLGISVCRQYIASGIVPVIKHIPGHGRAESDSHHDLPLVATSRSELEEIDFEPFKQVAGSDVGQKVWGMMAHVVYTALDPEHPASVSESIITQDVRKTIGFKGFLLADDVSMDALNKYGDLAERALASLDAGCDAALYCAGKFDEMAAIAEKIPRLGVQALKRL